MRRLILAFALALLGCGEDARPASEGLPPSSTEIIDPRPHFEALEGFWSNEQAQAILERTERLPVGAETSHLTAGEREALERLLAVGEIMQRLCEDARHRRRSPCAELRSGPALRSAPGTPACAGSGWRRCG